ncbi:hypothetical protein M23134_04036 [Microscilla marina ATCC 23134]|uniref:Uncharacterized protein n=2 Tax=Microscilla marina TaxID=1027 RepID=A1ZMU3_MICM2|nr:hypothetical protein M23134_04036 [Microscilla marina ATCC 23134]
MYAQSPKGLVSFFKDGKEIKLQDDFKIYIVLQDSLKTTVIKPVVKNNSFFIPNFKEGQKGMLVFKYRKYLIGFTQRVDMKQDIAYDFGIDYKPFDKKFTNGEKLKKVRRIVYLSWPYSKSRVRIELKKTKKYRRKILKLIE